MQETAQATQTAQAGITWGWIVTTLIALYGAALSTWNAVQAYRSSKPKVRVRFFTEMLVMDGYGGDGVPHVQVRVENLGQVNAVFESNFASVQMFADDHPFLLIANPTYAPPFPVTLVPGASFSVTTPTRQVLDAIASFNLPASTKCRIVAQDSILRTYLSDWVDPPTLE